MSGQSKSTVISSGTAQNIDLGLNSGNALLVELTGATFVGTVDFQSTIDGVTYTNHPYEAIKTLPVTRSVAQLSNPSTATMYLMVAPVTQARIAVARTSGTLTVKYREIRLDAVNVPSTTYDDDEILALGTDDDQAFVNRSAILGADTALTGVLVGTPVTPALAANSLIISNVTAGGDILLAANRGGNSEGVLFYDSSAGFLYLQPGQFKTMIAGAVNPPAPAALWHLWTGDVGTPSALTTLLLEGGTNQAISILSTTGGYLYFGDAASGVAGGLQYIHSSDVMNLRAGGATIAGLSTGSGLVVAYPLSTDSTFKLNDGGVVTQITSITTGVTLNTNSGQITTVTAPSIAAGAEVTFTVTNSKVAAIDTIIVSVETQFTDGHVKAFVSRVAAGAFDITIANGADAAAVSAGAAIINFALIKGSAT